MMDTLADDQPRPVLFGRSEGDLEGQRQVIEHPQSVFGLSDGGAHCGVLVDASVPTYMLSYFTHDRQPGPRSRWSSWCISSPRTRLPCTA